MLGAYYSPEPFARVLVHWALAGRTGTVIDPSYGGCAMLRVALDELATLGAAVPTNLVYGADIDGRTAQWAAHLVSQGVPAEHLRAADFLSLTPGVELPLVAAVVGNPPYVRHHRLSTSARTQAEAAMATAGVKLSGRASLWAYFVVQAARFVKPGGRMAMLLPGAVLHSDYAPTVLEFVERLFNDVLLVRLRQRIFHDAQEETVVLLASGARTTPRRQPVPSRFADVEDLSGLEQLLARSATKRARATRGQQCIIDGVAEWKIGAVSTACRDLLEQLLSDERVRPLGAVARVALGTVTGANSVFVLSEKDIDRLDVRDHTLPVVCRSAWLAGPEVSTSHLAEARADTPGWLLVVPANFDLDRRTRLGRYFSAAEGAGVDARHHCQRNPWWALGKVEIPDAFLAYTVGAPRGISLNTARAASTNTVHQITWWNVPPCKQRRSWVLSTWSVLGRVCSELYGRYYGGGVLKLELSAARLLPLVDGLSIDGSLWTACHQDTSYAQTAADAALLASGLGLTGSDLDVLQAGAESLADHRLARGRSSNHDRRHKVLLSG